MKENLPEYVTVEHLKMSMNLSGMNVNHYDVLMFLKVQERQKELGEKFSVKDGVDCRFWVEKNWEEFNKKAKKWILDKLKKEGGKIPEDSN